MLTRYEEYLRYLQSTEWRALADACKGRDYHTCQLCGDNKKQTPRMLLDAHHHTYPKRFQDDSIRNLVTLCRPCHNRTHLWMKHQDLLMTYSAVRIATPGFSMADVDRVVSLYTDENLPSIERGVDNPHVDVDTLQRLRQLYA